MTDIFSRQKRSAVMSAIRSKGNKKTELRMMKILRSKSISGWRRNQSLPGKPDFVFQRNHLVVFIDGCFWHSCPKHGRKPVTNRGYWLPKLRRNQQRDVEVNRVLRRMGWGVLRIWEHELGNSEKLARRISRILFCMARARCVAAGDAAT